MLPSQDVVKKVPVFGAWVSPCCLEPILLLEQTVGDNELMLRTELQKQSTRCHCSCQFRVYLRLLSTVQSLVPLLRRSLLRYEICFWSQLATGGYAGRGRRPRLPQFQPAE